MMLSNRETHIIQSNTISFNREKSYWNSLNYKSNSLHKKTILSNFVVRTNVYRWFTDMFLWEFINRFANACKSLVAQLVTHDKSVGFVMLGYRLIIWRSQVQALAGPQSRSSSYGFRNCFFYGLVPAVLGRGMFALLKSRQNRCSKQRKAVFLW